MSILRRSPRNLLTILLIAGLATIAPSPATAAPDDGARGPRGPARINLPNWFQPEGIAIGRRPFAYLGSLRTGDIYRANLRTGTGRVISPGDNTPAVGLKLGPKGRLWVAGGVGGDAKVVSTRTGRVRTFELARGTGPTFVNDVVLRNRAAWFTDSNRAVLYRVAPLSGRLGRVGVSTVPITGAWTQVAGQFNANGISTTPNRRALLVVNSFTGALVRVNPRTGRAAAVGLGGYSLTGGDGMLRRGRTLYVAQNQYPEYKVVVLRLSKDGRFGRLVRTLRQPSFDFPTTIARFGSALYLPNARFATTPTPTTRYWITRVRP